MKTEKKKAAEELVLPFKNFEFVEQTPLDSCIKKINLLKIMCEITSQEKIKKILGYTKHDVALRLLELENKKEAQTLGDLLEKDFLSTLALNI